MVKLIKLTSERSEVWVQNNLKKMNVFVRVLCLQ